MALKKKSLSRSRKPRRTIDLRILIVTTVVVSAACIASYLWYKSRSQIMVKTLIRRADQLAAAGQWREAAHFLNGAVLLRPADIGVRTTMATYYVRAADDAPSKERAIGVLYRTLGFAPDDAGLRVDLARLLYEVGSYEQALRVVQGERGDYAEERIFVDESENRVGQEGVDPAEAIEQFQTAQRIWALAYYAAVDENARLDRAELNRLEIRPKGEKTYGAVEKPARTAREDSKDLAVHPEALAPIVDKAVAANPSDVQLVAAAADLYSRYADALRKPEFDPMAHAYALFDRLVELEGENAEAWIARYRFRSEVESDLQAGIDDLNRAIVVDPKSVDGLYLRGVARLRSGAEDELELTERDLYAALESALTSEHAQVQMVMALRALSDLIEIRDGADDAIAFFEAEPAKEIRRQSMDLSLRYVDLLLRARKLAAATKAVKTASQIFAEQSPQWPNDFRAHASARVDVLKGAIELASDRPAQAAELLTIAVASMEPWATKEPWASELDRRARLLLADAWAKQNAPARAAEECRIVADRYDPTGEVWFLVGENYRAAGLLRDADRAYQRYLQSNGQSPLAARALIARAESQLRLQLIRPHSERDWAAFRASLQQAQDALPDRWEPKLLDVDYLLATSDPQEGIDMDDVIQRVNQAATAHREEPSFWEAVVRIYARCGSAAAAAEKEAIEAFEAAGGQSAMAAILRAERLIRESRLPEAEGMLDQALADADAAERLQLQWHRMQMALDAGQPDRATSIADAILHAQNRDRASLLKALQVTLILGDYEQCRKLEDELASLGDPDYLPLQTMRAHRMLGELEHLKGKEASPSDAATESQIEKVAAQLGRLLQDIYAILPESNEILVLKGRYAALTNDKAEAIRCYSTAVNAGERRIWVLEHLGGLLHDAGRLAEASEVVQFVPSGTEASASLDRLAISLAVQRGDLEGAIQRASIAWEQNLDDVNRALWFASLLLHDDQKSEAEEVFKGITERFSNDMRAWHGLFSFYIKTGRAEEARNVLPKLLAAVEKDDAATAFITGQCQEQLGDRADALASYGRAVKAEPTNVEYRKRRAKLLLTTNIAAARDEYERLLNADDQKHDEEVLRNYAVLLASTGADSDWDEALDLLGGADAASGIDERLQAMLLTRRGRNREARKANCEAARQMLSRLILEGPVEDVDRILLANVCTQLAVLDERPTLLQRARAALQPLVDRRDAPPQYLAMYLEFLIENPDENAFFGLDSGSEEHATLNRIRDSFQDEAKRRVGQLAGKTRNEQGLVPLSVLQYELRVMQSGGATEGELVEKLNEYGKDAEQAAESTPSPESNKLAVYMGVGNLAFSLSLSKAAEYWYGKADASTEGTIMVALSEARQGKVGDAVALLRSIGDDNKQQVAKVLAQIFATTEHTDAQYGSVKALIDTAVQDHSDDKELLMAVAVMHTQQGDYEAAIKHLQRMVDLAPDDALALNNLATLLAETPGGAEEGLKLIEHALAIAGRLEVLLDTQGTLYLLAGDAERAVACLEEATAGIVRDPRFYLHLAAAYDAMDRDGDARVKFDLADQAGVSDAILTATERRMLQELQQ